MRQGSDKEEVECTNLRYILWERHKKYIPNHWFNNQRTLLTSNYYVANGVPCLSSQKRSIDGMNMHETCFRQKYREQVQHIAMNPTQLPAEQVRYAFRGLKNGCATGPGGILAEFIKAMLG